MLIKNKQNKIAEELEQRIASGKYSEKLPKALELAVEFEVNFKTLNKAIRQLVEKNLVYRKPGRGTFIVQEPARLEDSLIELLFVGSSEMSVHPFYSEMQRGILDSLKDTGFRLVLTMLEENRRIGGVKEVYSDFIPSAGKILIGTCNEEQIRKLKRQKVPFVLAGTKTLDPEIISIYTDTSSAIIEAIEYLYAAGRTKIAYLGITQSEGEHLLDLDKFHTYIAAVQKYGKLDSDLIEHTPPLAKFSYSAMKKILKRKRPDAVIAAYDHIVPGIYRAITETGRSIPEDISVVGIDGINPNVDPALTSIPVDRYAMGYEAGQLLIQMIRNPGKNKHNSARHIAKFDPSTGSSI